MFPVVLVDKKIFRFGLLKTDFGQEKKSIVGSGRQVYLPSSETTLARRFRFVGHWKMETLPYLSILSSGSSRVGDGL